MIFIETPVFTKQASGDLFTDEELTSLQMELMQDPQKGDLIVGSGGLRKIRVATVGKGKSGGSRVIYYISTPDSVFLLIAYAKSRKDTLTKNEIKILREIIDGS